MGVINNTAAFLYALCVYFIVILFVFFKLYTYKDLAVKYTDMKDAYIDIELGTSVPQPSISVKSKDIKELFNQKSIKKHISAKMKSVDAKNQKESNLNELFGKLEYEDFKSTKIQAAYKQVPRNSDEAKNITKRLDTLRENTSIIGQNKSESRAGVYDPFLGALRRILEERWRLYNASGDFSARVHFSIDANGFFYYNEVELSGDANFDKKLENFLANLKGKYLILPPNSSPYIGVLELSDKIK